MLLKYENAPEIERIPCDSILEVCTCGYVITSDADREMHMQEHYLSFVAEYDIMYATVQ